MDPVFAKLNLKDEPELVVLNAPDSFSAALATLGSRAVRTTAAKSAGGAKEVAFAIAFCTTQREVDMAAKQLTARAAADAKLWFAYPKQSSKRFRCEFNRDTGWDALGAAGYEGVRMVAIDEDWSALRFRRATAIKSLQRAPSRALSAVGRTRAKAAAKKK